MKRSADQIDRAIAGWEAMRSDFGPDAPVALSDIIAREIVKLERERAFRGEPQPAGRRTADR